MDRRDFILGLAVSGAYPLAAAQQEKIPLIGVTLAQPIPNAFMRAFQQGLRELGYIEGKTSVLSIGITIPPSLTFRADQLIQ